MFFRLSFSSVQHNTSGELFYQSRKGQEVLLKVKQFMKQHVYQGEEALCAHTVEMISYSNTFKDIVEIPVLILRITEWFALEGTSKMI